MAAGGTGGHIFPAQALGEEMLDRGWGVELWTDRRGMRFVGGFPRNIHIRRIPSATYARGGAVSRIASPFMIATGILTSWMAVRRLGPSVMAGFGGYPAFPPMIAAWLSGVPRLIHEQNGILGKANRLLARRVDVVACGAVATDLPKGVVSIGTGNPVRADVIARSESPFAWPSDGPIRLLVLGGSQGARILDSYVPAALSRLPGSLAGRIHVCQQVGRCQQSTVERYYREAGISCEVRPFFDDVPERIAASQLIISRAGASAVAEIASIGRPSILIPFAAAANDHQSANAAGLVDAGAAVQVTEGGVSAELLASSIAGILSDPARATGMAGAARKAAHPDATTKLADLVGKLARQGDRA